MGTLCSPPLLVVYTHVRCVCVCVFVFICVYACVDGHASVYTKLAKAAKLTDLSVNVVDLSEIIEVSYISVKSL